MATEIEITKRNFTSDYYNYFKVEKIAIEDCKFLTFVDLLDDLDVISSPVSSRANGTYKNGNWSLLGYSCESNIKTNEDLELEEVYEDSEDDEINLIDEKKVELSWEYSLFNGFFSDNVKVTKASKQDILKG